MKTVLTTFAVPYIRKIHSASLRVAIVALLMGPAALAFDSTPYPGPNPPDGSAAYPWKINLPEDLDAIVTGGTHSPSQHYLLTKNLDCGNQDHRIRANFTGTLDGGYHTISKIRVDQPTTMYVGLVQNMFSGGVIRKVAVVDSYFRAHSVMGPIAGAMQFGTLVEECYSQGNVIISVSTNGQPAGGIVGGGSYERPAAVVRNSFARNNTLSSNFQTVGGISGYNDAQVERCYSAGSTLTAPGYVGGVVGYGGSGTIVDSYSHLTNTPAVQVGSTNGTWQNTLVPDRNTSNFDITGYSIAQLNWDPAVWTKGADNYPRLAGFNLPPAADGDLAPDFNPNSNNEVYSTAVQVDGKLVFGGRFTSVGGTARNHVARLSADGTLDNGFNPNANDLVDCTVIQADGKIVIGGLFTGVGGVVRNYIARIQTDGTLDAGFNPNANSYLNAMAVQADGKIVIGGSFTTVGGVVRNRIARVNLDGTLDTTFNPNTDDSVVGVTVQADGKIVIVGEFTTVGGTARDRIARLNADGTLDPDFNPGADARVYCAALQPDGKILFGGWFNTAGGATRSRLVRINSDGTLDTEFNPNVNDWIQSISVQADGKIVIGGAFTTVGGTERNHLARLHADGTLDADFNPNVDSYVYGTALQADGQIVIGGYFTAVNGVTRNRIARLLNGPATQSLTVPNATRVEWQRGGTSPETVRVGFELSTDGTTWTTLGAGSRISGGWELTGLGLPANGTIRARAHTTGGYCNSSSWLVEQQVSFSSLAVPEISVEEDSSRDPILVDGTSSVDFDNLLVGSSGPVKTFFITNYGSANLTGLAITIDGTHASDFTAGVLGATTLAPHTRTTFTVAFRPGALGFRSAALHIANNDFDENPFDVMLTGRGVSGGEVDVGFRPDADNNVISVAVQPDGKIVLGGSFSGVSGEPHLGIARLNTDGTLDNDFNPILDGPIVSTAVQADGKIVIGGYFTTVNGIVRNCVARLESDGTLDADFDPNVNDGVFCMAMQADGKILIGGQFSIVDGQSKSRIARLNGDGTLDNDFNASANQEVRCIAVQPDGKILIGGSFTEISGMTRNHVARLQPDGTLDTGFNPSADNGIEVLALQADGKIVMGGGFNFSQIGTTGCNGIARLNADGTLDSGFNPNTERHSGVQSIALQSDGKVIVAGELSFAGGVFCQVARLNSDGTRDTDFSSNVDRFVWGTALQADGKIVIGGEFFFVGWVVQSRIARLLNGPATQILTVPSAARVEWLRGGTAPETNQVSFELSTDGTTWTTLGSGTRITGGWELSGLSLPGSGSIRARARTTGGAYNGSSGLVEQQVAFSGLAVPEIAIEPPAGTELIDGTASIDFGNVLLGSSSTTQTFTITNRGTADLTGLAITKDGSHPGDFTVSDPVATTLTRGESTTFSVTLTPTGLRSRSAVLHLASNDFDENPFDITLTGTGTSEVVLDPGFNPNADSYLMSSAVQPDGKIVIGGVFSTVGGAAHRLIARLNADGSLDTGFNPVIGGSQIHSIAVQADGKILIAGYFSSVGGAPRSDFARLNADGTLDTGFNPTPNGWTSCVVVQGDGKIVIGGDFSAVNGTTHSRIARINPDGSLDTGFNPNVDGPTVYSAVLQTDGKIVIGGAFYTVNGLSRRGVARLNADGTLDASVNAGCNGPVYITALQADGKIIISGSFDSMGGTTRNQIARLNADGTVDSGFDPNMNAAAETAVVQADGKILIGGGFATVGGTERRNLARLNANGTLDSSFEPNVNSNIYSTELLADGTILLGGLFTSVDGTTRNHIARLLNSPATQSLTVPSPARVEWQRGGTAPETTQVSFDLSTDGTTWAPLGVGTRTSGGWELSGLSLPANGTIRARARTGGGNRTSCSGLVESVQSFDFNAPPLADAGADQVIQLGTSAYLDGTATTDDLTTLASLVYAWTIESAPAGSTAVLTGATTATPSFVPDRAGSYSVKLTVTDAGGLQDTDETVVSVVEVIGNGSFENDLAGWTATGNLVVESRPPYSPHHGSKLVSFNSGNRPPDGVLSQVLQTIPGQAYRLEFDVGVLDYVRAAQRLGLVLQGVSQLMSETITLTGLGGGKILWVPKSYVFTADSATTTLTFRDRSTLTNSVDLLLDHVRVTPLVTTLLVTSSAVSGVNMEVRPPDTLGAGDGSTTLRRSYNPGTVAYLTAPAVADGGAFYNWLQDGTHFSTDRDIQVTMDRDHQMAAVYWGGSPIITVQPSGMENAPGGTAVFSVTASGAVPLSYQWRFNGDDIAGENARTLEIDNVGPVNVGTYDVVITNRYGSVTSHPAELTLPPPFTGLENGSFETDFQGWTVSGNVSIQSTPSYQPTDGIKLAAFNVGGTTPNGLLSQVFATTPGQAYFLSFDMGVLAYNTLNQVLEVKVNGSLSQVSRTFTVTGQGGGKSVWKTQTLPFTADSTRTTLTFRDRSTATDSLNMMLDRVAVVPLIERNVLVQSTPITGVNVTMSPADADGAANGITNFSRRYLNTPQVNLGVPAVTGDYLFQKWLNNGENIGTNPSVSVPLDRNCTLTAVYVVAPPVITFQPADAVSVVGGSATFRVTAKGLGPFSYEWRVNGQPVAGAQTNTYTRTDLAAADHGAKVDVVITNAGGSVTSRQAALSVVTVVLANSSFESDLAGWTSAGNVKTRTSPPPTDGTKLVVFNSGNTTPNGWISQTFPTAPGIRYLLSFDMGVLAYNTNAQSMQVDLTGSGAPASKVFSLTGLGGGLTRWETKKLFFTANSTATTLTFRDKSATTLATSSDLLLDRVKLELAPEEFALIPAGTFQMGDSFAEGSSVERPVHTVDVSAFHMATYEVTKTLWDEVKAWGAGHGYTDLPAGGGKAVDHPVHSINWFAMVKWCNARSERDGLTPCYTVSGTVYRTGSIAPVCNWSANGYRLPSEAEWENAARGGLSGKRFPWGDTISHFQANYYANRTAYGNLSGNVGHHPTYRTGAAPYTSPVGSFTANGYGLHDMAGNVWEGCWDWYSSYSSSPASDPRGAASGSYRVLRGGSWGNEASYCRIAFRVPAYPQDHADYGIGFRLARSSVP